MPTYCPSGLICSLLIATSGSVILLLGCNHGRDTVLSNNHQASTSNDKTTGKQDPLPTTSPDPKPFAIRKISGSQIENLHQLSEKIYSGGEPHSEQQFAAIAKLGCKTVISVDGAKPDVALAKKYGLKYIHIPIGYDRIERTDQLKIVHAMQATSGPVFFHCHHGKHRGPSAAAIGLMAETGCSPEEGLKVLEATGTSKDYVGLWRDVKAYAAPSSEERLPDLVSVAEVDSLIASMAALDRAFDNLKLIRKSEWKTPVDHPDLVAHNEAELVRESFAESKRLLSKEWPQEFSDWLAESESAAKQLIVALKEGNKDQLAKSFQALENGCVQCHQKYRN